LGACAASAVVRPLWGQRPHVVPFYKAIFDERFEAARAFGDRAAKRGIRTAAIRGDVTSLFFDDLDLRWRRGPLQFAGYTTRASLFCLDLLARDRGMRINHLATEPSVEETLGVLDGTLSQRRVNTFSSDPQLPVFWIIAPNARISL